MVLHHIWDPQGTSSSDILSGIVLKGNPAFGLPLQLNSGSPWSDSILVPSPP